MSDSKLRKSVDSNATHEIEIKFSKNLKSSIDENLNDDRETLLTKFNEMQEKKTQLMARNKMLSVSVGYYFERKKIGKAFHDLTETEVANYTQNYHESLEKLWRKKLKFDQQKSDDFEKISEFMEELEKEEKVKNALKEELKSSIQNKAIELETAGVPITEKVILRLLNRFEKIHSEVCDSRLEFIKTQTALAEVKAKDEELDDLGDGYKVIDYENLKTELQTISSNIDSKNEELEKLRMRYNSNVEKSKEYQKNRENFEKKIEHVRKVYDEKKSEEQQMQWELNNLRKQKDLMRHEYEKLLQKSQLLIKTPLLRNYDNISDELENIDREIEKFEGKCSQITREIEDIEIKIDNLKSQEKGPKDIVMKARN